MKSAKIFIIFAFLLAFAFQVLAQKEKTTKSLDNIDLINMNNQAKKSEPDFVTPNELEGYEFFKKGKLNMLRLGVSTRADVEKVFGSDCEKSCSYSPEWTISIDYFNKSFVLVSRKYDKNRNTFTETQYVPKKEAIGKINSIALQPKKRVSFKNVVFSSEFVKSFVLETGYLTPGKNDTLGASIDFYMDNYGLQYFIFDKIVNDKLKDTFGLKNTFAKFQKGDLLSIKYVIPEEMESRFLIEEK